MHSLETDSQDTVDVCLLMQNGWILFDIIWKLVRFILYILVVFMEQTS